MLSHKKQLINWLGLLRAVSLLSHTVAVILAPPAYPGYNWISQAVSDLSASNTPSKMLRSQLSGLYGVGVVPKEYFGIPERFPVFAAAGFRAVIGVYLFRGFKSKQIVKVERE